MTLCTNRPACGACPTGRGLPVGHAPHAGPPSRRGTALILALVALVVVAALSAAITWQCMAGRRLLQQRHKQLQAEWLARAGVELAADRLLTDPDRYKGESVELVPEGRVRIEVRARPGAANVYEVTSEARFPGEGLGSVLCSAGRSFRRTTRDNAVRLEVVADDLGKRAG